MDKFVKSIWQFVISTSSATLEVPLRPCKRLFDESIKPPAASNNSRATPLNHINIKLRVKLDGHCLKEKKVTFTHKQVVDIYVVYEINLWPFTFAKNFALVNSSFGAVELTKNTDFDKYKYFGGYGTEFDALLSDGSGFSKNIIIFGRSELICPY